MISRGATRRLVAILQHPSTTAPKARLSMSAVRRAATLGGIKRQVTPLSLSSNNATNQQGISNTNTLWIAAAAAIFSGSTIGTVFLSEKEEKNDPTAATIGAAPAENEEEEEDPYENLPEEDEPTDCSMCNTFRQGPCRPYWRKVERCFKDHEGQENGASHCLRYFMPHQECLMNYTNLYNLIRMTSLQEYIDETEMALPANQRVEMDIPASTDWSLLHEFQKDVGPNYTQGLEKSSYNAKKDPLWKRFPEDTEPVVLTFSMEIPREDTSGLLLRFAYVVDQDGMVLGVESNLLYRKLKDEVEGRKRDDHGEDGKDETESGPKMKFEFYVIPNMTQKVRVKAMYAKDPRTPGLTEDGSDDLLKESPMVDLSKV